MPHQAWQLCLSRGVVKETRLGWRLSLVWLLGLTLALAAIVLAGCSPMPSSQPNGTQIRVSSTVSGTSEFERHITCTSMARWLRGIILVLVCGPVLGCLPCPWSLGESHCILTEQQYSLCLLLTLFGWSMVFMLLNLCMRHPGGAPLVGMRGGMEHGEHSLPHPYQLHWTTSTSMSRMFVTFVTGTGQAAVREMDLMCP